MGEEKIRVLLIEDSPELANLMKKVIESSDVAEFKVDACHSIQDATYAWSFSHVLYDAVVLDLMLPDSSGVDTYRKIREAAGRDMPIHVFTGSEGIETGRQLLDEGAETFTLKPMKSGSLKDFPEDIWASVRRRKFRKRHGEKAKSAEILGNKLDLPFTTLEPLAQEFFAMAKNTARSTVLLERLEQDTQKMSSTLLGIENLAKSNQSRIDVLEDERRQKAEEEIKAHAMKMDRMKIWVPVLIALLGILGAALGLSSCVIDPIVFPPIPGITPVPRETPTPSPSPTPREVGSGAEMFPAVRASAVMRISGLSSLDLRTSADYIVAGTFTWETSGANKKLPILELSIRGTRNRPCLRSPCGDDAGLVVRATANPKHDATRPESEHCGSGTNYHRRIAIGDPGPDDSVDISISWDEAGVGVSSPVESTFIPSEIPGSFGFGRFLQGAPFSHGQRGFGWSELSIQNHGGSAKLTSFSGERGVIRPCPP